VAEKFQVKQAQLKEKSTRKQGRYPRQVAMYLVQDCQRIAAGDRRRSGASTTPP